MGFLFNPCQPCCSSGCINWCGRNPLPSSVCYTICPQLIGLTTSYITLTTNPSKHLVNVADRQWWEYQRTLPTFDYVISPCSGNYSNNNRIFDYSTDVGDPALRGEIFHSVSSCYPVFAVETGVYRAVFNPSGAYYTYDNSNKWFLSESGCADCCQNFLPLSGSVPNTLYYTLNDTGGTSNPNGFVVTTPTGPVNRISSDVWKGNILESGNSFGTAVTGIALSFLIGRKSENLGYPSLTGSGNCWVDVVTSSNCTLGGGGQSYSNMEIVSSNPIHFRFWVTFNDLCNSSKPKSQCCWCTNNTISIDITE